MTSASSTAQQSSAWPRIKRSDNKKHICFLINENINKIELANLFDNMIPNKIK